MTALRCGFDSPASRVRIHVGADEQYELFLDGQPIGSGSERSDPSAWAFDSYDLDLAPGHHTLVARVWTLGPAAPRWRMGHRPGFVLATEDDRLAGHVNTGVAAWQARELPGYRFTPPFDHDQYSIAQQIELDAVLQGWRATDGGPGAWLDAEVGPAASDAVLRTRIPHDQNRLVPAQLPPPLEQRWGGARVRFVAHDLPTHGRIDPADHIDADLGAWQSLLDDRRPLLVAGHQQRRLLIDLGTYFTGRVMLRVSGGAGARLQASWAESLFEGPPPLAKGDRGKIEHKEFVGVRDTFLPDGSPDCDLEVPAVWRAGRYLELRVQTSAQTVTFERVELVERRYPLREDADFLSGHPRLNDLWEPALVTLRASCHDAVLDGPYYEQMMWAGDGVQNALDLMALTGDDRLVLRWLTLLDQSRDHRGLTAARWPARDRLTIPAYSLYWVQVLHHYARWRDDVRTIRSLMPGVRAVLDTFGHHRGPHGLLEPIPGWNFVDWVDTWPAGVPPDADLRPHAIINWHLVGAMTAASELEDLVGEPLLAERLRSEASGLATRLVRTTWSPERGLLADTADPGAAPTFSEHTQCMALLSGQLDPDVSRVVGRSLLSRSTLTRGTLAFAHYFFECCQLLDAEDAFFARLEQWFELAARGLKSLPERQDPTRSDCHAWSSHPLFHSLATVAGIRPADFGFSSVEIRPWLGICRRVRASVPHPRGKVVVDLRRTGGRFEGWVELPDETPGRLVLGSRSQDLSPGRQLIHLPAADAH